MLKTDDSRRWDRSDREARISKIHRTRFDIHVTVVASQSVDQPLLLNFFDILRVV